MINRVVAFEAGHYDEIFAGDMNHEVGETTLIFRSYASKLQIDDLSHTYISNGHVIAVGGVAPLWPGVGEGWVVCSAKVFDHGVGVARSTRGLLDEMAANHNFHRIQSAVLTGNERLERFAKFLGFQREGIMRRYGTDQKDYAIFARIF